MERKLYKDVCVVDVNYPDAPARWQQFKDMQTDEIITSKDLEGWILHDTLPDSFGRLIMTFKNFDY